jgi:hypothetical protein
VKLLVPSSIFVSGKIIARQYGRQARRVCNLSWTLLAELNAQVYYGWPLDWLISICASAARRGFKRSFPNRPHALKRAATSLKTPPVLSIRDILTALITPLVAIAYLAFCYLVHNRPVRLGHLVDVTEENLYTCCPSLD